MMCVLGVGVSSGLGPMRVHCGLEGVWGEYPAFRAQLRSSQLPPAVYVDTMLHVRRRPSNGSTLLVLFQIEFYLQNVPKNSSKKKIGS